MAEFEGLFSKYDRLVLFDTETTGLEFSQDEIIEFAAVVVEQREGKAVILEEYDELITLSPGKVVPDLIRDLNTLKYSCNPYNVNRMTSAAGIAAIQDDTYFQKNISEIQRVREYTRGQLEQRGFTVLPSVSNFLFVRSNFGTAEDLYGALRALGVLIRYWKTPRIKDWCRITIGTQEQMDTLLNAVDTIRKERGL